MNARRRTQGKTGAGRADAPRDQRRRTGLRGACAAGVLRGISRPVGLSGPVCLRGLPGPGARRGLAATPGPDDMGGLEMPPALGRPHDPSGVRGAVRMA